MLPIQTALLYAAPLQSDLMKTGADLIDHLNRSGCKADEICPAPGDSFRLRMQGLSVGIALAGAPVDTDTVAKALNSPLSRQTKAALQDTLATHRDHLLITLDRISGTPPGDPLEQLRFAHKVITFIAARTDPQAVHWRQSNLLLSGKQYGALAEQKTPWTLFADLHIQDAAEPADNPSGHNIEITNAGDFIGAPIRIDIKSMPIDTACAAALAFLRHAVQSGDTLANGQTIDPGLNLSLKLNIQDPDDRHPLGLYQLSEVEKPMETVPDVSARASGALEFAPPPTPQQSSAMNDNTAPDSERTRSLALSFLMLVIMPPLGAVLLVSNVIFGVNAWRTGFLATLSVAAALVLSAYVFLNVGEKDVAVFEQAAPVQTNTLD